jgi:hypothetical protein
VKWLKRGTREVLPVVQLLCEEQVSHSGADIIWAKITPSVIRKNAGQKFDHGRPSRVSRVVYFQAVSHQEEVNETELVQVQGGMSIGAVSVGEAASSTKVSRGGSGIER